VKCCLQLSIYFFPFLVDVLLSLELLIAFCLFVGLLCVCVCVCVCVHVPIPNLTTNYHSVDYSHGSSLSGVLPILFLQELLWRLSTVQFWLVVSASSIQLSFWVSTCHLHLLLFPLPVGHLSPWIPCPFLFYFYDFLVWVMLLLFSYIRRKCIGYILIVYVIYSFLFLFLIRFILVYICYKYLCNSLLLCCITGSSLKADFLSHSCCWTEWEVN
jgi:hypothetical protein